MPTTDESGTRLPGAAKFKRGAVPTPRYKLLRAHPFRAAGEPPAQFAFMPKQLSVWGNNQYGDCVTAEEAFAKACYSPKIFIEESVIIDWARRHNVLNGAMLTDVMDMMRGDGFHVGSQTYNDGAYSGVDYSNESVLRGALCTGPVKIAIDADALGQGAGNASGWYSLGGRPGQFSNTDHCVALSAYGPADWLYQQLGVDLPVALRGQQSGYLLFTWGTIGFVDHAWIMSTCTEAWIRNPTTTGVPPLPDPTPPPVPPVPPAPPVPPGPAPSPVNWMQIFEALVAAVMAFLNVFHAKMNERR